MVELRVKVYFIGKMVINMKEIGKMINMKEMGFFIMQMVTNL